MNYNDQCKEIFTRSRKKHIAVFAIKGEVFIVDAYTGEYSFMLRKFPTTFVGIYNNNCTLKMIQDDIL